MGSRGIWALLLAWAHFGCTGCSLRHGDHAQGIRCSGMAPRSAGRGRGGIESLPLSRILRREHSPSLRMDALILASHIGTSRVVRASDCLVRAVRGGGPSDFSTPDEEYKDQSPLGSEHFKFDPEVVGIHEPRTPEEASRFKFLEDRWNQKFAEWTYCLEGEGRPLKTDPVPYDLPNFEEKDICWNYDGMNPPPEVWRNPRQEDKDNGWRVCPETAPVAEVIKDFLRSDAEEEAEEARIKRDGPEFVGQEKDVDGNDAYEYWDRDGGTRPFTNLRSQLPPGWRQIKFCGSTLLLSPDGTFVHNDDPEVTDPRQWGADPNDRGEWRCDGPSWEESQVLTLAFNDEKKRVIQLRLHAERTLAGKSWAYTGEDPVLDPPLGEVLPNIHDGVLCDDSSCERCADEQGSDDPNASSSGHIDERIEIPEEVIPGLDELEARL